MLDGRASVSSHPNVGGCPAVVLHQAAHPAPYTYHAKEHEWHITHAPCWCDATTCTPSPPAPVDSLPPCTVPKGVGVGGASLAPKVDSAKRAEETFSSGCDGVVVERSSLGPRAWSPRGGGGGVIW